MVGKMARRSRGAESAEMWQVLNFYLPIIIKITVLIIAALKHLECPTAFFPDTDASAVLFCFTSNLFLS